MGNPIKTLKIKIDELEELATEIEKMAIELINNVDLKPIQSKKSRTIGYYWDVSPENLRDLKRKLVKKYQRWFSTAHQLVKMYLPEKEEEFVLYYNGSEEVGRGLMQLLQLRGTLPTRNKKLIIESFISKFDLQRSILLSIPYVVEIKELNLRKLISADFVEEELEQAELLLKNGFHRASGVLAGVALEKYLKTLCIINNISFSKRDTITPLAQKLYKANLIDITELKRIEYLSSIRNKCSHPHEVTENEVKSLIEGVKQSIFLLK